MFSGQAIMPLVSDEFNGAHNYFLGWLTVSGILSLVLAVLVLVKYLINEKKAHTNSHE
jgi:O-antigen ligase